MADKKKIFILEDDETILVSLKKLLTISGFEIEATQYPREALAKIKSFQPHLILLDLLMPGITGIEICQMLNKDKETKSIPIIVISALAKEIDIKKAYELGVVSYLVKPYDFPILLKEINKVIGYKEEASPP